MEDSTEKTMWKLTLAYDGTEFHGWQIQANPSAIPTIQARLAEAIAAVTGEHVLPQGSGRTDAGVHALGQVANFALAAAVPARNLKNALNRVLPASIRVLEAEQASPAFHARHCAVGKIYRYRIFHGAVCSPFLARFVSCCRWPLDVEAMQAAAQSILGEHDFTSFAASDPDRTQRMTMHARTQHDVPGIGIEADEEQEIEGADIQRALPSGNVRRIDQSDWNCDALPVSNFDGWQAPGPATHSAQDAELGQMYTYTVRGNGFLHHMVRNLVGTFVEIGRGRLPVDCIPEILKGRRRSLAGPTAAASGLCLMKVLY